MSGKVILNTYKSSKYNESGVAERADVLQRIADRNSLNNPSPFSASTGLTSGSSTDSSVSRAAEKAQRLANIMTGIGIAQAAVTLGGSIFTGIKALSEMSKANKAAQAEINPTPDTGKIDTSNDIKSLHDARDNYINNGSKDITAFLEETTAKENEYKANESKIAQMEKDAVDMVANINNKIGPATDAEKKAQTAYDAADKDVTTAEGEVKTAQGEVTKAENNLEEVMKRYNKGKATGSDVNAATAALEKAKANLAGKEKARDAKKSIRAEKQTALKSANDLVKGLNIELQEATKQANQLKATAASNRQSNAKLKAEIDLAKQVKPSYAK